jgi:preprotein translocase subunit YajC
MIFSAFLTAAQPAAQPARPAPQGNLMTMLLPFVLVFVIFYVLIILPQRKKQKKHLEMIENLKAGDRIITSGGIYGTVMGVQKDRIEVKISANTKIEITKGAIGVILGRGETPASEKAES